MKKSRYIIEHKCDGKYIIVSTMSGGILEVTNSVWENIEKTADRELLTYCRNCNILIDDTFDEETYVDEVRRQSNLSEERPHSFVVLPTTACNARCFYCYEEGMVPQRMTTETAEQVARYILRVSNGKNIRVQWFGGEPLMGIAAIDTICENVRKGLRPDQRFETTMISNGSLLNDSVIEKMVGDWNLTRVQITLDGLPGEYEKRKSYVASFTFGQLLDNINKLLRNKITVAARINFDKNNFQNILDLIDFLGGRINSEYFSLYAVPLFENSVTQGKQTCFSTGELDDCYMAIYQKMIANGFIRSSKYFAIGLKSHFCGANTKTHSVIDPLGNIYKCQHLNLLKNEVISHVCADSLDEAKQAYWIAQDVDDCKNCALLPMCQGGCRASGGNNGILRCCTMKYTLNSTLEAIKILNERKES